MSAEHRHSARHCRRVRDGGSVADRIQLRRLGRFIRYWLGWCIHRRLVIAPAGDRGCARPGRRPCRLDDRWLCDIHSVSESAVKSTLVI